MAELKPRLIMTSPGRKRRGFGTFFIVLIIFALGFYAGSKYGDYLFGAGSADVSAKIQEPDSTQKEQTISAEQEVPGRENMDKMYIDETQGTEDRESLTDGGFLGAQVLEDSEISQNTYPGSADPNLLLNDTNTTPEGVLAAEFDSNVSAESGNETDTAIEEAAQSANSYTLQVGAFSTPEEARSVANGYKTKGYNAYIVPIENSRGEKWNLVKIGKFNTIDQAWSYSSYFKNREGLDAYVETVEHGAVFNESLGQQEAPDQP